MEVWILSMATQTDNGWKDEIICFWSKFPTYEQIKDKVIRMTENEYIVFSKNKEIYFKRLKGEFETCLHIDKYKEGELL